MLRIALILITFSSGPVFADAFGCGHPYDGPNPWDYRDPEARNNPHKIPTVEKYHFTPQVEQLERGESTEYVSGDIGFVLRHIPNHPRALYAISRFDLKNGSKPSRTLSAECFFDRAVRFSPNDPVVWMLYGIHWAKREQHEKAVAAYEAAVALTPNSPELLYNFGLSLFALGDYEKARAVAINAYAGGYPLGGLRKKLKKQGYGWDDEKTADAIAPQETKNKVNN